MAYCKNCGQFIPDGVSKCNNCGVSVSQQTQQPVQQAQYQQPQQQQYQQPQYQQPQYQQPQQQQYQQSQYQQPQQQQYQQQPQQQYYQQQNQYQQQYQQQAKDFMGMINNTPDYTSQFDPRDAQDNNIFALLSYIGILFLVPLFARKFSPFCKFHANQGLILFIIEAITGVILGVLNSIVALLFRKEILIYGYGTGIYETNAFGKVLITIFSIVGGLIGLASLCLAIIGIINAVNGRAKELPFIGKFKIIK